MPGTSGPRLGRRPKSQVPIFRTAYAAKAIGALLSFATSLIGSITATPHRAKANIFRRPSILFRPHGPAKTGVLVESPGTAPGSDPLITCAFITIVPKETFIL